MENPSFSIEDIQRLQDQLLDKTQQNYELQERIKRLATETGEERGGQIKRSLQNVFASKTDWSKTNKSMDLEQDVCRKLAEQEAEFKLQTETLLNECQRLAKLNDELLVESAANSSELRETRGNAPVEPEEVSSLRNELDSIRQELQIRTDKLQQILGQSEIWRAEKASLESELARMSGNVVESREQLELIQLQLQESNSANDCLSTQLESARTDVTKMQQQLEQAELLAEQRKSLLDTMAEHMERTGREKDEMIASLKEESNRMEEDWRGKLAAGQADLETVADLKAQLATYQSQVDESVARNIQLEQNLRDAEANEYSMAADYEDKFTKIVAESEIALGLASQSYLEQIRVLGITAAKQVKEAEELAAQKTVAEQRIEDLQNEMKLTEKKHKAQVKDLKKQLVAETRRADRLQEKLLESATAEAAENKDPAELNKGDVAAEKHQLLVTRGDNSSVSSWSLVSKDNSRDSAERRSTSNSHSHAILENSDAQSCTSEVTTLELENEDLIRRLADLQKSNSELEEKVHLLEASKTFGIRRDGSTPLASPLSERQHSVLQSHVNEPRENWTPVLRKFVDLLSTNQTSADMQDMNKRLQLLLEETLTKNIHLSKDLELMSLEVQSLSDQLGRCRVQPPN